VLAGRARSESCCRSAEAYQNQPRRNQVLPLCYRGIRWNARRYHQQHRCAGGFEIYVNNSSVEKVWNSIFEAGKDENIKPIGLGARDTLRLEMGFCLYGNDIDDSTSPLEAGLGWITKFTKEFTNSASLKAQKEAGVARKLVGFRMVDKGIPRHDYLLRDAGGNEIGKVTSGTMSPMLGIGIGLGYVKTGVAAPGSEIFVDVRGKLLKAKVHKLPLIQD